MFYFYILSKLNYPSENIPINLVKMDSILFTFILIPSALNVSNYSMSSNNYNFLPGDFNKDGRTDLIHLYNSTAVRVWFSNGDGTFSVQNRFPALDSYEVDANNYTYLVGDFCKSDRSDLVHLKSSRSISMWQSNLNGTFNMISSAPPYDISQNNYYFLVGDFSGDGLDDLVNIVDINHVRVWISKGDGTFTFTSAYPAGSGYTVSGTDTKFIVGDFNGDGKADLVHFYSLTAVKTWISQGDGTFTIYDFSPWTEYNVGFNNFNFITGDFNGDGISDLLHFYNSSDVFVWCASSTSVGSYIVMKGFPNNGYAVNENNYDFIPGNFNLDTKTDLIHLFNPYFAYPWLSVGTLGQFSIGSMFPNNGYAISANNYGFIPGDFNQDSRTDLIHLSGPYSMVTWLSSTRPTSQDFTVTIACEGILDFSQYVASSEILLSPMKIKLYSLPSAGTLVDTSTKSSYAVPNAYYNLNQLMYSANSCNYFGSDNFTYAAVDNNLIESAISMTTVYVTNTTSVYNVRPTATGFTRDINCTGAVYFNEHVSSGKYSVDQLKIIVTKMPIIGKLWINDQESVVEGNEYLMNYMQYQFSKCTAKIRDYFAYKVIDLMGMESVEANVVVNNYDYVNPNYKCLKLKQLHLDTIADLDGVNEEIEIQISTHQNIVDCGIFFFNPNNYYTSAMNIFVPCQDGMPFNVTFIERDVCNDDLKNISLMCTETNQIVNMEVDISTSKNYRTSHYYSLIIADKFGGCSNLTDNRTPQVGGRFCDKYTWVKAECGSSGNETITAQYTFQYEITSENCEIFWDYQSTCYLEPFINGVSCNDPFIMDAGGISLNLGFLSVWILLG